MSAEGEKQASGRTSVLTRLTEIAERFPERVACRVEGDELTYAELLQRAKDRAGLLSRQGTSPVILRGGHCTDEIIMLVACIFAGRAYVSVPENVPEQRFSKILRMTGSDLVARPGKETEELEKYRGFKPLSTDNETAYIIFTSGSTGTPKGVSISYDNLWNFIKWISGLEPFSGYSGVNVLNQAALGFDLSVADVYYALCNGHTWVAEPAGLAGAGLGTVDVFKKEMIDVAVMTPSALKMCLLDDGFSAENVPDLKAVFFCGERLEKKTVQKLFARFPGLSVINAYGPTEATCAVCAVRITEEMLKAEDELPVGRLENAATSVTVDDREIVLTGASVFGGYLDGHKGGCFTKDGVNGYRTGDFGFIRNGLLYYTGRSDNQIKYKGYRIELDEIENCVKKLAGVRECAVIAKHDRDGNVKTIQAYVAPEEKDGAGICAVTSESICSGLGAMLPGYMIPKTVVLLDRLPLNPNGKIDRKALETL